MPVLSELDRIISKFYREPPTLKFTPRVYSSRGAEGFRALKSGLFWVNSPFDLAVSDFMQPEITEKNLFGWFENTLYMIY